MATATATKAPEAQQRQALEWAQTLRLKFKACVSHVFVITGNVRDIVDNRLTLETYLSRMFLQPAGGRQNFDLVIFYDRANGLRFPLEEMKEKFMREVGLVAQATQTAGVFGNSTMQGQLPKDPQSALELVEKILKMERKSDSKDAMHTVFIVDYAESLFPKGAWGTLSAEDRTMVVKLLNWAKDPQISANANPVILIADSAVMLNDAIVSSASRVEQIEVLLPTPEERLSFIEYVDNELKKEKQPKELKFEKGFDKRGFAHLTAGLKKLNIEDIKLTAEQSNCVISPDMVKRRKKEIYAQEYQSQLQVIEPEHGWPVLGGYQWVKDYFSRDVIPAMLEGDTKRCPQGILLVGPPGTGKSVFASALAYEARMNMVEFNVGKLLGSLVGESEHNTMRAMLAIRSLTPVLVWMDEIDQAVTRGSHGDSGVSDRIFKMILEFMSDPALRGKVLWVAATNRPDQLDPALKRRGRFDKIIPFLPPDAMEREAIFQAVMVRHGYKKEGQFDLSELASISNDWVGSDIESGVIKAYQIARRNGREAITQDDLVTALNTIIPATADVRLWTQYALVECSDIDLLPPQFRVNFSRARAEQEVKRLRRESLSMGLEDTQRRTRDL